MKPLGKRILLCAFILFSSLALRAQQPPQGNFRLGFSVSATIGRMDFESGSNYSSRSLGTGMSYGVIGDFGFARNYFFGTGFLITNMEAETNVRTSATTTERINYKIQYIELPLTLKLKTSEDRLARLYAQFGPDLGIKVANKHTITPSAIKTKAELIRLGLLVGAGSEFKFKGTDLLLGVSYNNPFTKVFKNPDAKNNVIMINGAIFF